jgi:hypothetical protein
MKKSAAITHLSSLAIAAGLAVISTLACSAGKRAPLAEPRPGEAPAAQPTPAPAPPVAAVATPPAAAPPPEAAPVPAPPVHPELLTDKQMQRTQALQATLAEVDPTPLEEWIEDVTRAHNPERELKMYEGMAKAYRSYCTGKSLSHDAKMDVYQVVLLRSGAKDSIVLPQLKLKELPMSEAEKILRHYPVPPMTPAEARAKL